MKEYSIFRLEEKDAPELARLEAACFSLPWSEEQYRKILRAGVVSSDASPGAETATDLFGGPTSVLGIHGPDGHLAAYLSLGLHHAAGELEVYNIAVRPELRQAGLGRKLLSFALRQGEERGFTRAVLEVRPGNAAALALYARLGFSLCGRRKRYYTDTGEDALVLERILGVVS